MKRTSTTSSVDRRLLIAILLAGSAVRIILLTDNRFHADEALFAGLARLIASGKDLLLSHTHLLVDKPPLFYYQVAGGIAMCWGCELTARLPGLFASVISLALTARLAHRFWKSYQITFLATIFYALSPFAILFSPTVFSDPLMVMWILAASVAVSERRSGWAGLLWGISIATKQNALFFLPLVIGTGLISSVKKDTNHKEIGQWVVRFIFGSGVVVAFMIGWDWLRHAGLGFWSAGFEVNNPGRIIRSNEIILRAQAWWRWGQYIGGSKITHPIIIGLILLLIPVELRSQWQKKEAAYSLIVITFILGYLGLHWLVAFPVFDRYLLPLVPLFALMIGRAVERIARILKTNHQLIGWIASVGLIAIMIKPAILATQSQYPVGGDHGGYDGIEQVSEYLAMLPDGSVIYNMSLEWHFGYYLADATVFPIQMSSPAALSADLKNYYDAQTAYYLVLSQWDSSAEVLAAVDEAGFKTEIVLETRDRFGNRSFTIYVLQKTAGNQ